VQEHGRSEGVEVDEHLDPPNKANGDA